MDTEHIQFTNCCISNIPLREFCRVHIRLR